MSVSVQESRGAASIDGGNWVVTSIPVLEEVVFLRASIGLGADLAMTIKPE